MMPKAIFEKVELVWPDAHLFIENRSRMTLGRYRLSWQS